MQADPVTQADEAPQAAPVAPAQRFGAVDILRGFAVFGILIANMASYSGRSSLPFVFSDSLDQWIVNLSRFVIEAKFYSLFSLLFGWGMALQMSRARAKGIAFVPVYVRRMLALLLIGVVHGVFIWTGDILTLYAVLGLLLLLFRNLSPRKVLLASVLFLLLRIALTLPDDVMAAVRQAYENATSFLRSSTYSTDLYAAGSYWEITRLRLQEVVGMNSWFIYSVGPVFSMFLLGLYAGKRRIVEDMEEHLPLLRRVMWAGLTVGLVFNALFVWSTNHLDALPPAYVQTIRIGSRTVAAPAMMLFYASGILLLTRRESWYRRLSPLGNVGRMALTNYLLQSALMTLVFYGYGLGLYGRVDASFGLLLSVLFFLLQIRWSAWWLERFQYGPAEWVWRLMTYGRRPPLGINEEPGSLKPLPLAGRIQPLLRRAPPLALLGGAWALLLLWGAGLYAWSARLEESQPGLPLLAPARATAAPATGQASQGNGDAVTDGSGLAQAPPDVRPLVYNPGPAAAAGDAAALAELFDVRRAIDQVEALSAPEFEGRESGSPGGYAAGDYIAEQFARYRLLPAGDDGTFFQNFPVNYTPLASVPELEVWSQAGDPLGDYRLYEDFNPVVRMYAGEGVGEGPAAWADDCQQEDLDIIDVVGKVVLCETGISGEAPHLAGRQALEHGAVGLLLLTDPDERPQDFGDTYREVWVPAPIPVLRVTPDLAADLLTGSGYTLDALRVMDTPALLATEARLSVDLDEGACPVDGCAGRNVLGVIPGRDPAVAGEVVILGAHYDHLGKGPEGTYWAGANDNASGVAAMLEIARAWDAAGYVPRRTVLFAAWDAEEKGLVGSQYYVDHPRLPLEDTVAAIQMDMVGAGADELLIDGAGDLSAHLLAVAEGLEVPARIGDLGRSDHVPFLNAGVPASLVIWWDEDELIPHYHRTADTPGVIDPDKLEAAGLLTGLGLLDIAESEPAIRELLERRAAALVEGDIAAFIETGLPGSARAERAWYESLQALEPLEVRLAAGNLRVVGPQATADLEMEIRYPGPAAGDDPRLMLASLAVMFVQDSSGWHYAGPNLERMMAEERQEGQEETAGARLDLAYPPGIEADWGALSEAISGRLAEISSLLNLPAPETATVMLLWDDEDLRISTALTMPEGQRTSLQPGELRMIYSQDLLETPELEEGLTRLLLAEAGLTEASAPWLWVGLPLAVRAEADSIGVQAEYVPQLGVALEAGDGVYSPAEAWAAVDFALDRLGWPGLGGLIEEMGRACEAGPCTAEADLDAPLQAAMGMGAESFEAAWRADWRDRLQAAQALLDEFAAARSAAVLDGDQAAFLASVDPETPHLLEEEVAWFAALSERPLEEFSMSARPLAWLEGDRLLSSVDLTYRLEGADSAELHAHPGLPVVLRRTESGLTWSGPLLERFEGQVMDVLYPAGREDLAGALLEAGERYHSSLQSSLGFSPTEKVVVALYENPDQFQSSIDITAPGREWVGAWTGPGQSIKIRLTNAQETLSGQPPAYVPRLLDQMTRHFLLDRGVRSEWLLKGLSAILIGRSDGGWTQREISAGLPGQPGLEEGRLEPLAELRPDHELSAEGARSARVQAWDSLRYFLNEYGWDSLLEVLEAHGRGAGLANAVQASLGVSLASVEDDWRQSLARGHIDPAWQEAAAAFDEGEAMGHVEYLASPDLAGRRPGSSGDQRAQAYIADLFRAYGLVPAGEAPDGEGAAPTFFQTFTVTDTLMAVPPSLELDGAPIESLVYRRDFIPLQAGSSPSGGARGPLVWVDDADYETLDLDGEIILRNPSGALESEIDEAVEAGAGGLILLGFGADEEALGKDLLLDSGTSLGEIPVFELTRAGTEKILTAAGASLLDLPSTATGEPLGLMAAMAYTPSEAQRVETANVLGLLPGSDPYLAQEVIILGAHFDHVGDDPGGRVCALVPQPGGGECVEVAGLRFSGANDNASGVGVLLEIARLWHEGGFRPKRSVLFAAWGAQELGQLGSGYFLENPTVPLDHALGVIQLDGVGGGEGFYLSGQGAWEQDGLLLGGLQKAGELFEEKLILSDGSVVSDQVPFREAGFPGLLVQWRLANEANLPDEVASRVDPGRLGTAGRLVSLALMALAGG